MFPRPFQVVAVAFAAAAAGALPSTRGAPEPAVPRDSLAIPASIRDEHMELLAGLVTATTERGPVGEAAREPRTGETTGSPSARPSAGCWRSPTRAHRR